MVQKVRDYLRDALVTIGILMMATVVAYVLYRMSNMETNTPLVYCLGVMLIVMYTSGYKWGVLASAVSVLNINYFFTKPVMKLNFLLDGYPITFIFMLVITILVGTLTAHSKERQKIMLESEKEKMRANLLRAISHDLRTPLTGIIASSQACLENPDLDKREMQRMLGDICEDSNWLLNMVENILSVTRIGSGDAAVKTNPEPLDEIISYSVRNTRKRYPQAAIQVELPQAIVMVSVDSTLIVQVIMNLLENAIKYSGSEEPILLKAEVVEKLVRVSVRDYGRGIPADRMKDLFGGTYVCKDARSDARRGMGIGLSLCRTIILAHGGKIDGKNHEKGAEMYFYLPLEGEEHESENTDIDY
ncbi:MAG: DUF4118 domain-containing protein [Lachnospiraceae bacterium]|nr:DUF4118 domain-containing protein [Lachnospiraceae bacterium]